MCLGRLPLLPILTRCALAAVLAGCGEPSPPGHTPGAPAQPGARADTVARRLQVLGADCGLFPAAAQLLTDESGRAPVHRGRFTPTPAQALRVEHALRTLPLAQVSPLPGHPVTPRYPAYIHQHLARYKRQYFGFYDGRGHACLYVHFFAEQPAEYPGYTPAWLRAPVQPVDGGAGYWSLKYDETTHRFYDFEHNSAG